MTGQNEHSGLDRTDADTDAVGTESTATAPEVTPLTIAALKTTSPHYKPGGKGEECQDSADS